MSESTNFYAQAPGSAAVAARFAELHPGFDKTAAVTEAHRCLYCFDAPCMGACPTHIDVPGFITKIATGNLEGSAKTILEANILGASCARACPVEVLCEGACVMHRYNRQPIEIGRLQRYAMDALHASGGVLPFVAGEAMGKNVALIGAGPASLACAAELRRRGVGAVIFDARALPGGLNTYGVAEYKLPLAESLREIDMLTQLGVEFEFGAMVDAARLAEIERAYDAVFLGMGMGAIHQLGIAGEGMAGVTNALDFIAGYKSGEIVDVAERVAVIGAGNTAIDAAIAAVRLGAEEVYLVYRRGEKDMSAFSFEYEHAKQEGVRFHWYKAVTAVEGVERFEGIRVTHLQATEDGSLVPDEGKTFSVAVGLVVLAIGQATHTEFLKEKKVRLERGRVVIDRVTGQTSDPKYFAGGDCANGGREVVDAVADGKRAGVGIAAWLEGLHSTHRDEAAMNGAPGSVAETGGNVATLETTFAGIRCLNPFWLASAPPTNCGEQIMRAFDAGWGGAVWKTIGAPITNVSSRYSSINWMGQRMMGFNNIELISDRPTETNLREIAEVKRRYPKHVVIASLMVESKREAWHEIVQRAEGAGADGLELNFGCPHGMSERGMGSAVGQVPEYCEQITGWVKEKARTPVIVKLTPNISDIRLPARAAKRAGADALSAINTINSITGIDLETLEPRPNVDGKSSHGGYCGPAVKPIALNMVQQVMSDPEAALPMSGIGGIGTWQDAAEFMLLGAGTVQVCTAAMHYGYRIVEDMGDGLLAWMRRKGYETVDDFRGLSLPNVREWKKLNLNFRVVAEIHADKCIGCQLCYTACWDGAHQCIHMDRVEGGRQEFVTGVDPRYAHGEANPHGKPTPAMVVAQSRRVITTTPIPKLDMTGAGLDRAVTPLERIPRVDWDECVGCNLCSLVCPVEDCITMERVKTGLAEESWEERVAKGAVMEDVAVAGNPNL